MTASGDPSHSVLSPFVARHIGPRPADVDRMLAVVGCRSLEELADRAVPEAIRLRRPLALDPARTEAEVLADLRALAARNASRRSFIGMGYADCLTPPVIRRCVFENPGWYTAYTPYQPEIAQGRLEALLNFQTMVADLTALDIANASLLDEGTAAAEAMTLCSRVRDGGRPGRVFFVDRDCHPQTIAVVQGRAAPLGIEVVIGDPATFAFGDAVLGALVQYPNTDGLVLDLEGFCARAHEAGALVVVATDLLALTLLRPPGEFGADVAIGNSQRFGVPLGYGGPHAAFMATREAFKRQLPGRLVGVSRDAEGRTALRLALQTREQHIRRDKATSNICTAQVLLAVMASMYAVYHGPEGLTAIAAAVHRRTRRLAEALRAAGWRLAGDSFFDTLRIGAGPRSSAEVLAAAEARAINLRRYPGGDLGVSLDETTSDEDLADLAGLFSARLPAAEGDGAGSSFPAALRRRSPFLRHPVFHRHRSETEFMRYVHRLETRDLALNAAMIPLGSCTMKLNAAAEMYPVSDPGFARVHPFVPREQAAGYAAVLERLGAWLREITGFDGVSFMPNAGAQGEYAGLMVIRAWHASRGEGHRDVCLIPASAHGTNPASAALAGMRVIVIRTDALGNIDVDDLRARAVEHRDRLAALMVTYPSTHGVFEEAIADICRIVHEHGGQVYLDGANMNAMVGLCRPGDFGADVCHVNLHKTFCIPHGGGGPGMGPIGVAAHLTPFLPGHPLAAGGGEAAIAPVSSAPFGSPSITLISYAYIAMMGAAGLTRASLTAILAANYVARRLGDAYPLLFRGVSGLVAHECILDVRPFRDSAGVEVEDVAKRLIDYGFHAPTMSFPVAGTLMIEPTESEPIEEIDRFCDAMLSIREEIRRIETGEWPRQDNPLKKAPHTAAAVTADRWDRAYAREVAAFPAAGTRDWKFWPATARIDNVWGDRNLFCSCPPIEELAEVTET